MLPRLCLYILFTAPCIVCFVLSIKIQTFAFVCCSFCKTAQAWAVSINSRSPINQLSHCPVRETCWWMDLPGHDYKIKHCIAKTQKRSYINRRQKSVTARLHWRPKSCYINFVHTEDYKLHARSKLSFYFLTWWLLKNSGFLWMRS